MKLVAIADFDWDAIINQCLQSQGKTLRYTYESFPNTKDFLHLDNLWQEAGYKHNSEVIEWINYFPEINFDNEIVTKFENLLDNNVKPWMVWISRIRPGKMAPWHFDAHQKIEEFTQHTKPIRYTCYIQDPSAGHVSIVQNDAIYNPKKGSVYEWPSFDAWHCGMNGGFKDKFMFNYWGYL